MSRLFSATYALLTTIMLSAPAFADMIDTRPPIRSDSPVSNIVVGGFLFVAALAAGFIIARKMKEGKWLLYKDRI